MSQENETKVTELKPHVSKVLKARVNEYGDRLYINIEDLKGVSSDMWVHQADSGRLFTHSSVMFNGVTLEFLVQLKNSIEDAIIEYTGRLTETEEVPV